jgi:hypothetical protein
MLSFTRSRVGRGIITGGQFKFERHKASISTPLDVGTTDEQSRYYCHAVSLEAANTLCATEKWPDEGSSASYEFGNGCNITIFLNQNGDGYDIYGSRHNKQGAVLNFSQVAKIQGLDNFIEVQAAMYKMARELPGRRKKKG